MSFRAAVETWVGRAKSSMQRRWYLWMGLFLWKLVEDRLFAYLNQKIDDNSGEVLKMILEAFRWSNENTLGVVGIVFFAVILVLLIHAYFRPMKLEGILGIGDIIHFDESTAESIADVPVRDRPPSQKPAVEWRQTEAELGSDAAIGSVAPTRHYSSSDKDRISDAFYELAEILDKHANPMERKAQSLIQLWNRNESRPLDTGLDTQPILEQAKEVDASSGEINKQIYIDWLNKFSNYGELLNQVLGATSGVAKVRPIRQFQKAARDFIQRLKTVDDLHRSGPERTAEIVELFRPTMENFREATGKLNGWINQTSLRIKEEKNKGLS